jgi:hypothetical protein
MSDAYCPYCDVLMTRDEASPAFRTKDHVIPQSRGGRATVFACKACNGEKADLSLHEWLAKLQIAGDARVNNLMWFIGAHLPNVEALEKELGRLNDPVASAIIFPAGKLMFGADDYDDLTPRQQHRVRLFAISVADELRGLGLLAPPSLPEGGAA